MIRRRGAVEEESSSDEEDAFAALHKKPKLQQPGHVQAPAPFSQQPPPTPIPQQEVSSQTTAAAHSTSSQLPMSITSSMKRHHKVNQDRQAKMEALLQELDHHHHYQPGPASTSSSNSRRSQQQQHQHHHRMTAGAADAHVAPPKGSFVDPSEEHTTTNLFVGNLDPSLTEQDVRHLFSQFGELYSVKLMYPRTQMERGRNRMTGFVCFLHRRDAERAMGACNDADPFHVGRLLMVRWGKSVLKRQPEEVEYNDDDVGYPSSSRVRRGGSNADVADPHEIPLGDNEEEDVAATRNDGSPQQQRGRERERGNRSPPSRGSHTVKPRLAKREQQQFDFLIRQQLSISRATICEAMAFCFENSACAHQISDLLRESLLDASASMEIRIARLFLLSDILFNSQQPGVRNAFVYRDAVEKMAPAIFTSLGKHGDGQSIGRMTMQKLHSAVSAVLGAWTEWSVYNPVFLDELDDRYHGREVKRHEPEVSSTTKQDEEKDDENPVEVEAVVVHHAPRSGWMQVDEKKYKNGNQSPTKDAATEAKSETLVATAQTEETEGFQSKEIFCNAVDDDLDGASLSGGDEIAEIERSSSTQNESLDGSPIASDIDGKPLNDEAEDDDLDGEPLDDEDELNA